MQLRANHPARARRYRNTARTSLTRERERERYREIERRKRRKRREREEEEEEEKREEVSEGTRLRREKREVII